MPGKNSGQSAGAKYRAVTTLTLFFGNTNLRQAKKKNLTKITIFFKSSKEKKSINWLKDCIQWLDFCDCSQVFTCENYTV